jgi:hypothetical protein
LRKIWATGVTLGAVRPKNYRRGYMGRNYHVTGGHEAEALAAERAKDPSRLGLFVLRLLGFKGRPKKPTPPAPPSPRHEKRSK